MQTFRKIFSNIFIFLSFIFLPSLEQFKKRCPKMISNPPTLSMHTFFKLKIVIFKNFIDFTIWFHFSLAGIDPWFYTLKYLYFLFFFSKELSLCNKVKYLNPNIFRARCCKPLIFQTLITWFNRIHSLKYLWSVTFGSKD